MFRYQELLAAENGYQILEGSHLEDALCTWSQFADESISEESMKQLEQTLHECNQRRDELKSTHDRLVVHHTALADQIAQLANISTASKSELQQTVEQVQVENTNVSGMSCTVQLK